MTFGLNTQNPLISNGKFLTPDNYWVEINDNNEIPKILNDIGKGKVNKLQIGTQIMCYQTQGVI